MIQIAVKNGRILKSLKEKETLMTDSTSRGVITVACVVNFMNYFFYGLIFLQFDNTNQVMQIPHTKI